MQHLYGTVMQVLNCLDITVHIVRNMTSETPMMRTSWRRTSWMLVSCGYLLWSQSLLAHHWRLTARRPCWLWWAAPGRTSCCNPRSQSPESASSKSQLVFFSPWHPPNSPSSFPHPDQGCHNRKPGKGVLFFLKMFQNVNSREPWKFSHFSAWLRPFFVFSAKFS